jgi:uncharacterized membrane protein
MAKHDNNAIIFLLCIVIGILFVLMFYFLLRMTQLDKSLEHNRREVNKAIVLLREERGKFKEKKDERLDSTVD